MFNISENALEKLRTQYPKGTRVKLIKMNDYQAPPKGTGTVNSFAQISSDILAEV